MKINIPKLLVLILLLTVSSCTPECSMVEFKKNNRTGKFSFSEVIYSNGTSQNELYRRSQMFLAKTFNSSKSVIAYSDKEEGYIIGNAMTKVLINKDLISFNNGDVSYSIEIICREGKLQVSISDFVHTGNEKVMSLGPLERASKKQSAACVFNFMDSYSKYLIEDMKRAILIPPAEF